MDAPAAVALFGTARWALAAPLTPADNEVSGYRAAYSKDPNDFWRLEVVDDWAGRDGTDAPVRALTTRFRLLHVQTGCYLRSACPPPPRGPPRGPSVRKSVRLTDVLPSPPSQGRHEHTRADRSHPVVLPDWGFGQHEVTCRYGNAAGDAHTIWNVEEHRNPRCA